MNPEKPDPTECPNLRELFPQYRIDLAPDAKTPRNESVWLQQLRCKYGFIAPYGRNTLQAVTTHPRKGAELRRLSFLKSKRGDVEVVVVFELCHVEVVLLILRPRKRRQLSTSHREAFTGAGGAALARFWKR
jgi:hypothetical protein